MSESGGKREDSEYIGKRKEEEREKRTKKSKNRRGNDRCYIVECRECWEAAPAYCRQANLGLAGLLL